MLGAVYHGQRDIRVQRWGDLPPPGLEEVQLQVLRASLCGTDVDEFDCRGEPVFCEVAGRVGGAEWSPPSGTASARICVR